MSTEVAWADLASVADIAHTLGWSDPAYVYLECVPQALLDEQLRRDGIRLEHYAATTRLDVWQRGRIFDAQQELKWELHQGTFRTIYCGKHPPAGFTLVPLQSMREMTRHYYLWGQQVKEKDRKALGLSSDAQAFIELQIPRILHYPVPANAGNRVQVIMHECYAADGSLCYARWCGLETKGRAR